MSGRHSNQDELDQRIEEWTRERTPEAVMNFLQEAGVPAGMVQDGERHFRRSQSPLTGVFHRCR